MAEGLALQTGCVCGWRHDGDCLDRISDEISVLKHLKDGVIQGWSCLALRWCATVLTVLGS